MSFAQEVIILKGVVHEADQLLGMNEEDAEGPRVVKVGMELMSKQSSVEALLAAMPESALATYADEVIKERSEGIKSFCSAARKHCMTTISKCRTSLDKVAGGGDKGKSWKRDLDPAAPMDSAPMKKALAELSELYQQAIETRIGDLKEALSRNIKS